jgi:curved DNA-binding protein CbpA
MDEFVDYYDILELKQDCTQKEIKNAYYRLVKIHHPDHGGSKFNFQQITDAYETLRVPEKRAEYDAQHRLNQNREGGGTNHIFDLRKEYKTFVSENHKELTQREIDDIFGTQFQKKQNDQKFSPSEISTRLADIELEKNNVEQEFIDTNLDAFIKENPDVEVNDLMEFLHQRDKPATRDIIPFDSIGGIDSTSSYFSNSASTFDDSGYASISSSSYAGIEAFDTNSLSLNTKDINVNEFKKWKDAKVKPTPMKETEIKSYRDRRREEDEEIKRIITENTRKNIKETQEYLNLSNGTF